MNEMGGKEGTVAAKALRDGTAAADLSSDSIISLDGILRDVGVFSTSFPDEHQAKDSLSHLTRGLLKVQHIHPGKITCLFIVKPAILNAFGGMHGGAVGALAERVAIACARTVVGEEKELFLGELSMSYLSSAPLNVSLSLITIESPASFIVHILHIHGVLAIAFQHNFRLLWFVNRWFDSLFHCTEHKKK
ncbi:hypothetical protein DM860_001281 [Cuscuta australis]|uniref:Thioesterase domain-containing protein n=1 Tax=Cuscuta australis TaxID=267555 RepID=A0A328DXN9_9ASTE|nr:hypothetical protein DM860_001281 [Cuscuta australis]